MMSQAKIGLNELIEQVKRELLASHSSQDALFVVSEVVLEISFTVERELNGGIDLHVVQAGADRTTTDTQKVTVKLEALITPDEARQALSNDTRQKARKAVIRGEE
jgi:hypothetical protein